MAFFFPVCTRSGVFILFTISRSFTNVYFDLERILNRLCTIMLFFCKGFFMVCCTSNDAIQFFFGEDKK